MNNEEEAVPIESEGDATQPDSASPNRDPLTGAPGSHPVGTGIGSASAAAVGAAVGGAVAGPAGVLVGGAIGAVAGGAAGHAVGERANPSTEGGEAKASIEEPDDAPGRSSLLGLER
jgi:phage tail tape-measure protein